MQTFNFNRQPSFAELWDVCVYNLLYNPAEFKNDIEDLFKKFGITKQSKIIDTSAGGGFPALGLIGDGYDITCSDGFQDEVELFNLKAAKLGLTTNCKKVMWQDLPKAFVGESFDFLFCRGNSFIYADGGWNKMVEINSNTALGGYRDTLSIFYNLLKPGGWIYIDKFKDTETTHRQKVCEITVNNSAPEDLIFWTQRFPEQKIRQASMIRKQGNTEKKVPNITYDLSGPELESLFQEVGFKNIQKITLPSEKEFDIWIAQK